VVFVSEIRLFDEPDLDAEGISKDDENLFLVPGAKIERSEAADSEDLTDLLT
jgi:hypothetical protein